MVEVKGNNRNTILQELESIRHLLDEGASAEIPTKAALAASPSDQVPLFAEPQTEAFTLRSEAGKQAPFSNSLAGISENNPFLPEYIRRRLKTSPLAPQKQAPPYEGPASATPQLYQRLIDNVLHRLQARIAIIVKEELALLSSAEKQQLQQQTRDLP